MKKSICLFFCLLIGLMGYSQGSQESITDYFPMEIGTTWYYEIEVGQKEPFIKRIVLWPTGDGRVMMVKTSGLIKNKAGGKYQLVLQIIGKAPEKIPTDHKEGVELKIVKDELGVYSKESILLWMIPGTLRFLVDEMVLFSNTSSTAPPGWRTKTHERYGFYYHTIFYEGIKGSRIRHGDQSPSELQFIGKQKTTMLFERHFESDSQIELLWFQKDIGLIRFEQRIDDEVSMIWSLVKFVPPEK